jgi:cob(I)alamin adenosyltransferase
MVMAAPRGVRFPGGLARISYNSRVKIYTRTGDAGDTSLYGGVRVSKADARVDAYGEVDELNAFIGLARAEGIDADLDAGIVLLQRDLFALGAQLADPADKIAPRVAKATLGDAEVVRLEAWIDRLETELPPLQRFILAGGCPAGAALHVARTVCRRAERRIVALHPPVDAVLVRYVNRLSDLLFVLSRVVNHRAHVAEAEW